MSDVLNSSYWNLLREGAKVLFGINVTTPKLNILDLSLKRVQSL